MKYLLFVQWHSFCHLIVVTMVTACLPQLHLWCSVHLVSERLKPCCFMFHLCICEVFSVRCILHMYLFSTLHFLASVLSTSHIFKTGSLLFAVTFLMDLRKIIDSFFILHQYEHDLKTDLSLNGTRYNSGFNHRRRRMMRQRKTRTFLIVLQRSVWNRWLWE